MGALVDDWPVSMGLGTSVLSAQQGGMMGGVVSWAAWRSTRNQSQRLQFHWTWPRVAIGLTLRFTVGETEVLKMGEAER